MIRDTDMFTMGGSVQEGICDHCGNKIFGCSEFQWEDKMVYAPLLCETCGKRHNEDVGDNVKRLIRLEKLLRNIGIDNGYEFKFIDKNGEEIQK